MKKKAQAGPIAFIFLFIIFIIVWFVWLGGWLSSVGSMVVQSNNLTGFEAFAYSNLNLIVSIFAILGAMAYFYFSQG